MPKQYVPPETLDLTVADDASEPIELGRVDMIRFQAVEASGTWGLAVVTVEFSIDGTNFGNLPELGAITFEAADSGALSQAYYIPAVKRMRFRVSTDQAGACTVDVTCCIDVSRIEEVYVAGSGSFA